MGSFGDRLRREREMRGITLDEIAESTKIARRHLESLEKEEFDSLPGGIFNRGFVRSYARYLGIDEDQAVADYSAAAAEPQPAEAENKFPLDIPEPDPELNPRRSTLPLLLALLALVAVLAIFWARMRSRSGENQEFASASMPNLNRAPSPNAPAGSPDPSPEGSAASGQAPAASQSSAPADTQPAASPLAVQTPERLFAIVVVAKEDSWVSVTADGKTVLSRVLNAGEQQTFRAGKRIVFTTGNAGGLDVTFNGRNVGAIGNESERRVLTFTPGGLVQ